jgi:flagellar biosynthetic protein FliR
MSPWTDALAPDHWPAVVITGARFGGLMLVDPLWSMTQAPAQLRAALVVVFTLAVLPGVGAVHLPPQPVAWLAPLASEMMLGIAIGLVAAIFLVAVSLGGEVATLQMGLNLNAAVTGSLDGAIGGIGELERRFASTCYVMLGGHLVMVAAVAHSLLVIPPGSAIALDPGSHAVATLAGTVFSTGARIAAPLLVTLLLTNLAIGVLSRAVPQLHGFAATLPITLGLGFLVCGATLPYLAQHVASWVGELPRSAAAMIRAFTPITP